MLTNNFINLISFYKGSSFKNVLGNDVTKITFLGGQGQQADANDSSTINAAVLNKHEWRGCTSSFNYDSTNATNTYTDEQTSYKWLNVVNNSASSGNSQYVSKIYNGFVLFVGTNDNEENENIETTVSTNDYCLNNSIELSVVAASCIHNASNKTYISRTFENNTENDVTIKEVGCYVFKSVASCTSSSCPSTPLVMIGREILETPITIPVGEQRTFTYVIDLSTIQFN